MLGLDPSRLDYAKNKFLGFRAFHLHKLVVPNKPVIHGIEVSNKCNLKCRMCNRDEVKRRGEGLMSLKNFRRLVDENSSCFKALALFFHGEPLMNPDLEKMVEYVRPFAPSLSVTSNGMLATKDRVRGLIEAGIDEICFSFDAPNKEVYEFVRVNAKFEVTKKNILDALAVREELGASTRIYLAYVLMDKTRPFIEDFRSYWMDKGIDTIRFIPMHGWGGVGQKSNKVLGDTTGLYRFNYVCPAPWIGFHVFYNGDVAPCCVWTGTLEDEHLGNVFEKSAEEIWNDKPYKEFRRKMIYSTKSLHRCAECTVEPYTNLSIGACEPTFPFSKSFLIEFIKEPLLRRVNVTRAVRLDGRNKKV